MPEMDQLPPGVLDEILTMTDPGRMVGGELAPPLGEPEPAAPADDAPDPEPTETAVDEAKPALTEAEAEAARQLAAIGGLTPAQMRDALRSVAHLGVHYSAASSVLSVSLPHDPARFLAGVPSMADALDQIEAVGAGSATRPDDAVVLVQDGDVPLPDVAFRDSAQFYAALVHDKNDELAAALLARDQYLEVLAAVREALDLPYPATVRDEEIRSEILKQRAMHVKHFLVDVTGNPDAASLAWQIGHFGEQIATCPAVGYVTMGQAQQALAEGATWSEAVDPARYGIPSETDTTDRAPVFTLGTADFMAGALDQIEAIGGGPALAPAAAMTRVSEAYDQAGTL